MHLSGGKRTAEAEDAKRKKAITLQYQVYRLVYQEFWSERKSEFLTKRELEKSFLSTWINILGHFWFTFELHLSHY